MKSAKNYSFLAAKKWKTGKKYDFFISSSLEMAWTNMYLSWTSKICQFPTHLGYPKPAQVCSGPLYSQQGTIYLFLQASIRDCNHVLWKRWIIHNGTLKILSGGFSIGWPVAGMGMVTDPDHFGMFLTLDSNVLHNPNGRHASIRLFSPNQNHVFLWKRWIIYNGNIKILNIVRLNILNI